MHSTCKAILMFVIENVTDLQEILEDVETSYLQVSGLGAKMSTDSLLHCDLPGGIGQDRSLWAGLIHTAPLLRPHLNAFLSPSTNTPAGCPKIPSSIGHLPHSSGFPSLPLSSGLPG